VWDDIDRMVMVARVPSVRVPVELAHEKILQVVELQPEIDRLDASRLGPTRRAPLARSRARVRTGPEAARRRGDT
jgi:hypothetical protein